MERFGASDRNSTDLIARGVGRPRWLWREVGLRGEGRNAAQLLFPDTENVRRIDLLYCGCRVNGWAIKWTPNATKLDRRSVYTIIRPQAKLHPNSRTFFMPLIK